MRLVRQIIAWWAAAGLLAASVYAPLFHVHADAGGAPLVHAHLPEVEAADDDSVVHIERPHSHAGVRSVDLLTTTAAHFVQFDVGVQSTYATTPEPQPS